MIEDFCLELCENHATLLDLEAEGVDANALWSSNKPVTELLALPSLDLAVALLRPDSDGILKLKIKRELRKRASAPVPLGEAVTARTHIHTLANVEYALEPITDLTPAMLLMAPLNALCTVPIEVSCKQVYLALRAHAQRVRQSTPAAPKVAPAVHLASPAESETSRLPGTITPAVSRPTSPARPAFVNGTSDMTGSKRKRRWDETDAVHQPNKRRDTERGEGTTQNALGVVLAASPVTLARSASGSSAPIPVPDWSTIARIQSMAARAAELWPAAQTTSTRTLDSPIDFVLYRERLARREWVPQWYRVQLRFILALMPKLPFKMPNLGMDAEKALAFSVDRSKLPALATYSLPTQWTNKEGVLEVMGYLYDTRGDSAPVITAEHASHLFSIAQPGLISLVNALCRVIGMRETVAKAWQSLRASLELRSKNVDSRTRDPVAQHCKLVEELMDKSSNTLVEFFMHDSRFRDIPGGPEIATVIGDGPMRRLTNDATIDRLIGL